MDIPILSRNDVNLLPVEIGEEATLRPLNKILNATLKSEPFELNGYKFVACHHRVSLK